MLLQYSSTAHDLDAPELGIRESPERASLRYSYRYEWQSSVSSVFDAFAQQYWRDLQQLDIEYLNYHKQAKHSNPSIHHHLRPQIYATPQTSQKTEKTDSNHNVRRSKWHRPNH